MAAVLQFQKRDRESRSASLSAGPAEIIIFPGVRFERLDATLGQDFPQDGKPNGSGPMQHRAAR